jgi:hypothetical protein
MLGIGCPDRHALPRITPIKCTDRERRSLPRERVRSSTHCGHSLAPASMAAHATQPPLRTQQRNRKNEILFSGRAASHKLVAGMLNVVTP